MKTLRLETVLIKREKDSAWETMISVNEGDGPLIDMDGRIVPGPIWSGRNEGDQVMTVKVER